MSRLQGEGEPPVLLQLATLREGLRDHLVLLQPKRSLRSLPRNKLCDEHAPRVQRFLNREDYEQVIERFKLEPDVKIFAA